VLAIAHRFGNEPESIAAAVAAGADLVELDVWPHRGRLEVRHLKTMGPVPLLWDRRPYRLVSGRAPRLQLADLLADQPAGGAELMLDLKGHDVASPRAVVATMEGELADRPYTVCSQSWELLDAFAELSHVRVVHSVGNRRMLARVLERLTRHDEHGVSVDLRLLDRDVVALLRERAPLVMTWRVNDTATLERVLDWGVTGVITDEVEILRALRV
jgi:glycerophosphoryl diester phosphodiesterase